MGKDKKGIIKDIILKLQQGLSVAQAKKRIEKEIGPISPTEIIEMEQSLIAEGLSPAAIGKFRLLYPRLFQSVLERQPDRPMFDSHPVPLFQAENREIEKFIHSLRDAIGRREADELASTKERFRKLLEQFRGIGIHYRRKEELLAPFLERRGLTEFPQALRQKDSEIKDRLETALTDLARVTNRREFQSYTQKTLKPLLEEIEAMIFTEENILFPASLEKLDIDDWVRIAEESDSIGYVFIERARQVETLLKELKARSREEPAFEDNTAIFPNGTLSLNELMHLLNTLPFDFSFIDDQDKVKFFSEGKDRIFGRERSVIGRAVRDCHQTESVDVVEKILASFKDGSANSYEFWINYHEKLAHIRYFAVRDKDSRYLGTLEVVQDITRIKTLEGERRLLHERG